MLGFLGSRLGVGSFMNVIMVPYRYQNKKAFFVDHISPYRHTLCAFSGPEWPGVGGGCAKDVSK